MKWEDYNPIKKRIMRWEKLDVECPKCGEKIYKDVGTVYRCFPQQYRYKCFKCGWWDFK